MSEELSQRERRPRAIPIMRGACPICGYEILMHINTGVIGCGQHMIECHGCLTTYYVSNEIREEATDAPR